MNIFNTHQNIIQEYQSYIRSFVNIKDTRIRETVENELDKGLLWPDPLVQFNPSFKYGKSVRELCDEGVLHPGLKDIFQGYHLYQHQEEAIRQGVAGKDFIVTSGTGSGKSLTYITTIFNDILSAGNNSGMKGLIVYPMNALINSQEEEFRKFKTRYEEVFDREFPIRVASYTGQTKKLEREEIQANPPDILLTNYMMLELLMTRSGENPLREAMARHLKYLVFDELHTYRGRQGADVAMLIRRIRAMIHQEPLCIGTSATMVSGNSLTEQKEAVAEVGQLIFGSEIESDQIIVETLERQTNYIGSIDADKLKGSITEPISKTDSEEELRNHALAIWIENKISLAEVESWLHRRTPQTLNQIAQQLASETGLEISDCEKATRDLLEWSSAINERLKAVNIRKAYLPYRLHQFISQAGSVYVTLDLPDKREIRLEPGHFLTIQDQKVRLYQIVFSRYSGHEFLCVRLNYEENLIEARDFNDAFDLEDSEMAAGYLLLQHSGDEEIWSDDLIQLLPDSWIKETKAGIRVIKKYRDRIPQPIYFKPDGEFSFDRKNQSFKKGWFMPTKLLFDPTAGLFFDAKTNENTKLMRLCNEGRSTATTLLSFGVIKSLEQAGIAHRNQKLLSFTDNRQDAALQSGHFNDFINVGRLRSAIYHALRKNDSLDASEITDAVFEALQLDQEEYARQPSPYAGAREENERALKDYLTVRIIQDLERSWKFTMPNLEQCGLVQISYKYLEEIAQNDQAWQQIDLMNALDHDQRQDLLEIIMDYFRSSGAIDHRLISGNTYTLTNRIKDTLKMPWSLAEQENLNTPNALRIESIGWIYGKVFTKSAGYMSTLGRYIKDLVKNTEIDLNRDIYAELLHSIFQELVRAKYLNTDQVKGERGEAIVYKLNANMIRWSNGDGTEAKVDRVRLRTYKDAATSEPNAYFKSFYKQDFATMKVIRGQEHTGQISNEDRIDREENFRNGKISTLFCSPTMELGIDISDLNVVHMRNAPPNPSNYAQRSGRAGRSGQGALVFTYCSQYSPHDRHYFKNATDLVAGAVLPPKIDLTNEVLLIAHINALYLRDLGLKRLEKSISNLVLEEDLPKLPLHPEVAEILDKEHNGRSARVFGQIKSVLQTRGMENHLYSDKWIKEQIHLVPKKFNDALDRWRTIYNNAVLLRTEAQSIINNPIFGHKSEEKKAALGDQRFALRQISLLRCEDGHDHSEFYPYSYLAAEGFLPGYNFTRLPLRTFIAGTKGEDEGEYISRSRQVAIKEFAPRNIIYHNGGKYMINRMMVSEISSKLEKAKVALPSGYFMSGKEYDLETCPVTNIALTSDDSRETIMHLLPMTETATMRRDRINCDEEERLREGYKVETYFSVPGTMASTQKVDIYADGELLLEVFYMPATKIIKVNKNWSRVKNHGFPIDMRTGYWKKLKDYEEQDPNTGKIEFVKLYTDLTVDALYIQPVKALNLDQAGVTTLQYALKRAMEETYQAERNEIDVISMGRKERPNILAYEASEGSLGIMKQIVKEQHQFSDIIRRAYQICHFEDGDDMNPEAGPASYEDLLSYYNQRDHEIIDRFLIKDALEKLLDCEVRIAAREHADYDSQYNYLLTHMDHNSSTEETFLKYLKKNGLRLPDQAQPKLSKDLALYIMPDFQYEPHTYVFCDGSPHDDEDVQRRDHQQRRALRDRGYRVISWHYNTPLQQVIDQHQDVFTKVVDAE